MHELHAVPELRAVHELHALQNNLHDVHGLHAVHKLQAVNVLRAVHLWHVCKILCYMQVHIMSSSSIGVMVRTADPRAIASRAIVSKSSTVKLVVSCGRCFNRQEPTTVRQLQSNCSKRNSRMPASS